VLAGDGAAHGHAGFQDVGAEQLAAVQLVGSLASNRISGCRLPSPAWNTLAQRSWYFFSISAMASRMSARRLRGMVESMHM
jgi:hypothetical protein